MTDFFDNLVADADEVETRPDSRTIEETLLLGLLDPTLAPRILEKTRPGDFYFSEHRDLATVVFPMASEGRHIDAVTFRAALEAIHGETRVANGLDDPEDELRRLYALAGEVISTAKDNPPAAGQVLAYLDIFAAAAGRRRAKQLVAAAGDALDQGKATPEATAAQVLKVITDLEATQRLGGTSATEGEELDAYFAELEAKQEEGRDFLGLDTGFSHLNRVINGLTPGLIILGAQPATGKTTLAKQIADQVVGKVGDVACLFVSLEQSKEELRIKTLSRLSGVENRDLQRGRLSPKAEAWSKVVEAKEAFAGFAGRMQVLEGDRLTTCDKIRLAALQLRQKTQAAKLLVVVDYLQILPVEQDFGDLRQKVNFVTSELRRIGRDLDAPVLAIASVNRAAYDSKRGTMEAFKESGEVEYSADVALMLVRDSDKKSNGEENYLGVIRNYRRVFLDVIKNRNGEESRIELRFFPAVSRFSEVGKQSLPEG